MNNIKYLLEVGIYALAKSSEENNWFPGHIGASIIAIALFLEENIKEVSDDLKKMVLLKAEEIIEINAVQYEDIYSKEKTSTNPILDAVKLNIKNFSADGHGVIYGSLALKGIQYLDKNIKEEVITGIATIVKLAQNDNVERYWKIENYKEAEIKETDLENFKNVSEAGLYCLTHQENQLGNLIINDKQYYFEGSRLHEVTHSQALLLLDQLGYSELAIEGLNGLKKQIFFNKQFPKDIEPEQIDFLFDPFEIQFWRYPIKDYHHYKLAYAVFSLCNYLKIKNTNEILKPMSLHWKILNK